MSRTRVDVWPIAISTAVALAGFATTACRAEGAGAKPATIAPAERQIELAVQAAPEDRRDGARVLGYDPDGKLVELRAGTNDLVCLADDPADDRFSVACYHQSLEPFMQRGRELRAQGVTGEERVHQRWKEADEGKLAMPKAPATLYVLTGSGIDAESGAILDPYLRYVVYIPYATPESTGLPLAPTGPGAPWLMFPGTAGAHIMITPPKPEKKKPEEAKHDAGSHG